MWFQLLLKPRAFDRWAPFWEHFLIKSKARSLLCFIRFQTFDVSQVRIFGSETVELFYHKVALCRASTAVVGWLADRLAGHIIIGLRMLSRILRNTLLVFDWLNANIFGCPRANELCYFDDWHFLLDFQRIVIKIVKKSIWWRCNFAFFHFHFLI